MAEGGGPEVLILCGIALNFTAGAFLSLLRVSLLAASAVSTVGVIKVVTPAMLAKVYIVKARVERCSRGADRRRDGVKGITRASRESR